MVLEPVSMCGLTPCANLPISLVVSTVQSFACGPNLRSRYSNAAHVSRLTIVLVVQRCKVGDQEHVTF